jgi:transcriptional regulator with XRE-family HTH domain
MVLVFDTDNNRSMDVHNRVKALRKALGLTQQALADRTGGKISQQYLARIEGGQNKARSWLAREGLAQGFGLSVDDFDAYLSGALPLAEARGRAHPPPPGAGPGELRVVPDDPGPALVIAEPETPLVEALGYVYDKHEHVMADVDGVRRALARMAAREHNAASADLLDAARTWLDAAAALRKDGVPVTADALLWRVAVGRDPREQARVRAASEAATTAARELAAREGVVDEYAAAKKAKPVKK